jgi:hypothetical protein
MRQSLSLSLKLGEDFTLTLSFSLRLTQALEQLTQAPEQLNTPKQELFRSVSVRSPLAGARLGKSLTRFGKRVVRPTAV